VERINGKNVLITGCTTELGSALAMAFAEEKANLALVSTQRRPLEDLERNAGIYRTRVYAYRCDMADLKDVDRMLKIMRGHFDNIDIAVFITERQDDRDFSRTTTADLTAALAATVAAPIHLLQHLLPGMSARGSGHIVQISTPDAYGASYGRTIPSACEAAMSGFYRSLRAEIKAFNLGDIGLTTVVSNLNDKRDMQHGAKKIIHAIKKESTGLSLPFSLAFRRMLS